MKELRIGMIGYGFMGKAHSNAYLQASRFFKSSYKPVLKALCARNAEKAKSFADNWGYESIETDWRQLLKRSDIDAVDICTPNNLHKEIAIEAAKAGKMILCEKPLAMNTAEGLEMVAAVEKAGVANMVWYNYRRVPAVTLAKQIVESGKLGRIFHYRANFLQDWTINADVPQGGAATWRLDAEAAGSGVTGDLLAHCIDTALWINGSINDVCAVTETFVKERTHVETGKKSPVNIDDACSFFCHFQNGSLGLFESTRYAPLKSTVSTPVSLGICTICTASSTSITTTTRSSEDGEAFTFPMAISLIWATGGYQACRSDTSTPLRTKSPTSSRVSIQARQRIRRSKTHWKPSAFAMRSWPVPQTASGRTFNVSLVYLRNCSRSRPGLPMML
jgi:predicted dehydrogenase